ncbi:hypothetical protein e1116g03.tmp0185 [Eimeria tenella]|uniref:Uncharacterized protein n=1 Tax=Eimeria tenella TaxID=5802 RepID=C8TE52_EIMTE|nr:hypothetical protein e1116g03.tmp0185 [Eimeria tenella]
MHQRPLHSTHIRGPFLKPWLFHRTNGPRVLAMVAVAAIVQGPGCPWMLFLVDCVRIFDPRSRLLSVYKDGLLPDVTIALLSQESLRCLVILDPGRMLLETRSPADKPEAASKNFVPNVSFSVNLQADALQSLEPFLPYPSEIGDVMPCLDRRVSLTSTRNKTKALEKTRKYFRKSDGLEQRMWVYPCMQGQAYYLLLRHYLLLRADSMERWSDLLTVNLPSCISVIDLQCEASVFGTIVLETPCCEFISTVASMVAAAPTTGFRRSRPMRANALLHYEAALVALKRFPGSVRLSRPLALLRN